MSIINRSTLESTYTTPDKQEVTIKTNSNPAIIENMTESFEKEKYSQKDSARAGEELIQEIELNNNSDFLVTDIHIKDTMSAGATFKSGSVEINGESRPAFDPMTGFYLDGPIDPSSPYVLITYSIVVDENPTVDHITNKATVSYSVEDSHFSEDTNEVTINIIGDKIEIVKTASTTVAVAGTVVTFTHKITNGGAFTHTKLMFTDPLPAGISFVAGSVEIDGVNKPDLDPVVGFTLDDLPSGSTTTIMFDAKVE